MRPPSSFEHPTAEKMSATNASSAFALIVTVPMLCFLRSDGTLQVGHVAAIPGRVDHHLVDDDMRRQASDVADQVADIFRLSHARAVFLGYGNRPLVEDGRGDLAGTDDGRADAVDALLHVD